MCNNWNYPEYLIDSDRSGNEIRIYGWGKFAGAKIRRTGAKVWRRYPDNDIADLAIDLNYYLSVIEEAKNIRVVNRLVDVNDFQKEYNAARYSSFLHAIPQEAVEIVRKQPPQNHLRALELLSKFWQHSNFRQNAKSKSPAIVSLIINHRLFSKYRRIKWKSQFELMLSNDRTILAYYGFKGRDAVALSRKLDLDALTVRDLRRYRSLLRKMNKRTTPSQQKLYRGLLTLPRINAAIISLFHTFGSGADLSQYASGQLLKELANAGPIIAGDVVGQLEDCITMAELVGLGVLNRQFHSIKAIIRTHDTLEKRLDLSQFGNLTFPDPPLYERPYSDMIPIRTPQELAEWQKVQQNCIYSYCPRVAAGEFFLYKFTGLTTGTFAIRKTTSGWVLHEAAGVANAPLSDEVYAMIDVYVRGSQIYKAFRELSIVKNGDPISEYI